MLLIGFGDPAFSDLPERRRDSDRPGGKTVFRENNRNESFIYQNRR